MTFEPHRALVAQLGCECRLQTSMMLVDTVLADCLPTRQIVTAFLVNLAQYVAHKMVRNEQIQGDLQTLHSTEPKFTVLHISGIRGVNQQATADEKLGIDMLEVVRRAERH